MFKKITLYIVRTDSEGNCKNSAPCLNCFNVICQLNIKRMIFSTDTDFISYKPADYNTTHVSHGNRFLNQTKKKTT